MVSRLLNSKTFWVGISGIVTAIGTYVAGEISLTILLQTTFMGLIAIFLRDGIAKSSNGG